MKERRDAQSHRSGHSTLDVGRWKSDPEQRQRPTSTARPVVRGGGGKKNGTTVRVGSRQVGVSNLDKVLYPATGFTKGEVIDYYTKMAPVLLRHLRGRPLTLKRYPNGVSDLFFYEKRCPAHKPEWVATAHVPSNKKGGFIDYCLVDSPATLAWVANLASLELHTLLSKSGDAGRPTMMVFDLDPGPPAGLMDCLKLGLEMRDAFARIGLHVFPKTSGGKGLHLYVPLNTPVTFDETKPFAKAIAMHFERQNPEGVVSNMSKALRVGKILVDWSQNDEHKTTVCAYSLRAREHPTVSTPVTWKEVEGALKKEDATLLTFEAADVVKRVEKIGDVFDPVLNMKQRLPAL
jgi:bifunctional non-homologous end joining protein LigD